MVNVTCPSCGTVVDIDAGRGFGFCVNCGVRLTTSAGAASGGPAYTTGPVGQRITIMIFMPGTPAKISGSFSHFGLKWDGEECNTPTLGQTLRVDTFPGTHTVEVRQLNNGLFNAKVISVSGTFDFRSDASLKVMAEGDHLVLSTTSASIERLSGDSGSSGSSGLSIS